MREDKVRLDRIDAPEMSQPFGKDAQQYLAKLILGKEVCVMWRERDREARRVGWLEGWRLS